jgi:lysophospholipase L1-like esterase
MVTAFLSVGLSLVGVGAAAAAGSDTATAPFYLALGGSASLGYQPTEDSPKGGPTDQGYANDLVSYEAARGVAVQLTQLGCGGETTTSMLYGGSRCNQSDGTQLAEAISFLEAHQDDTGLVTIDLGFNNIRDCLANETVDEACVTSGLNAVSEELPTILSYLKDAAGPDVSFVGVGHYDPFLADALTDAAGSGPSFALASAGIVDRLNVELRDAYHDAGMPMADVAAAFEGGGFVHHRTRSRVVVSDAAYACALTWMCQPAPYGPDLHPNAAGYATIADAIEDELHSPW